jgi:hypothetical protein
VQVLAEVLVQGSERALAAVGLAPDRAPAQVPVTAWALASAVQGWLAV